MPKLFLDFETFFDDEYTLKKMTVLEYILDQRFEALGCAFAWENNSPVWVDGPDLPKYLKTRPWPEIMAISHNASFDMAILAFRYGIRPGGYGCTLSMARNWISHQTGSVSLEKCAKRYGLPPKMDTLLRTKGVNFHEMSNNTELHKELLKYGIDDVGKCRTIYEAMLREGFPQSELEIVDWVIRMVTVPQLEIDVSIVAEHLHEVQAGKAKLLEDAQLDNRDNLMRDDAFAAGLMMLGVDPVPRKVSKTTGKERWAFAKTDKAFTALLDHESLAVQALVAARLGHKSTLEETRAARFLKIGQITKAFPVPLRYSGAHTHRFSGDWNLNLQNLPNGSKLRQALKAPKGCVVVSIDASQIEARLNATLSGETWLIESFRAKKDVYCDFASVIYNRPIIKQLHPSERFVGKTAILSLGYGSSAPVFQSMCRNKGEVHLSDTQALQCVLLYRSRCPAIVDHWKVADKQVIPMIALGADYQWGALTVGLEKLTLPNGNALHYRMLRHEFSQRDDRYQWSYLRGDIPHKLYGAKLVENECQSLAFVHIAEVAMRVKHMTNGMLVPVHQVHDELIYVVPEKIAEQVGTLVQTEMAKAPDWLPEAPLAAEFHIGASYGDAK